MGAPRIVELLANSVNGIPLRWYEYDDHWIILMEDGRKVRFKKGDPEAPRNLETVQDDKPAAANLAPQPAHRRRRKQN